MVQNPPEGQNRVTPYLLYEDGAAAIEFLTRAFGLSERAVYKSEDGSIVHAELTFQDETIMLGEAGGDFKSPAQTGGSPVLIHLYVDDVDKHYAMAKEAGAKITREIADQEYGDRSFGAEDPEGHQWYLAQHVKDVEWDASG